MNRQKRIKKIKIRRTSQRLRIIAVVLFMAIGTYLIARSQAAAGYIYISPASASRRVGETFSVQVRIRTTSPINAAFVNVNYNARGLQYVSIQRGSGFPNHNNTPTQHTISNGTGTIRMQSTRGNSIAGDLHYATITFRSTRTGTYGVVPQSSSRLINYPQNEVAFTIGRGDFTFSNPPPPPPPPQPKPQPAPQPKPTAPPQPAPSEPALSAKPTAKIPKTTSAPSASNLKITDFAITDIGYRSAIVSWKTSKPATSKVNFGYNSDNMPYEILSEKKTTNHQVVVQGDAIRAGNFYAIRITSNDGSGPVTLDGEFDTKGIFITIKVNDQQGQPVSGAVVRAAYNEVTTSGDGTAELLVSEGSVAITAEKDGLKADLTAEVAIPEPESPQQEVTLTLTPESAGSSAKSQSNAWLLLLPLLGLGGAGLGVFVFLRRRQSQVSHDAPNVTITTNFDSEPTHHASLPELINQDLTRKRKQPSPADEEPEDMFSVLDHPKSPTPPIVHHTHPSEQKKSEATHTEEAKKDRMEKAKPTVHKTKPSPKPHKDAEIDPKDHSLRINHDD